MPTFWSSAASAAVVGGWRNIGGAAMIFQALKAFVFGVTIKTVEYPLGNLKTITIRVPTIYMLKWQISKANPGVDPASINQLAKWMSSYWTEEVACMRDVRQLEEGSWLFWRRGDADSAPIPRKGVSLVTLSAASEGLASGTSTTGQDALKDLAIKFVTDLASPDKATNDVESYIPTDYADRLIEMILSNDEKVLKMYRLFNYSPKHFKRQAIRYINNYDRLRNNKTA